MSNRAQPTEKADDVSWDIPLPLIDASPFQRRKRFDVGKLSELSDSIRKHGQLDDALVRPRDDGRFELISGERRKLACGAAGLETLRCKVREMSDDDARELVIIQQLQHDEWSVTEEAEGYAALLAIRDDDQPRFNYQTLAERIDKKESHIRRLVSILETPQEMRDAVDLGTVSRLAAAYVASVAGEKRRAEAARKVLHPANKTSPLTAEETLLMINRDYQRTLQGAPFSLKDETLLSDVGSCENCPLRTGNMPIYKDLLNTGAEGRRGTTGGMSPNLCTQPACYKRKCEAVESSVKASAANRGVEIMPDEESAPLFEKDGSLRSNSDYVNVLSKPDPTLCHHFDEEKMPTWKHLIASADKGTVKTWLAKNPATGDFVELIRWQDAVKCVNNAKSEAGEEEFFKSSAEKDTTTKQKRVEHVDTSFSLGDDTTIAALPDGLQIKGEVIPWVWILAVYRKVKA